MWPNQRCHPWCPPCNWPRRKSCMWWELFLVWTVKKYFMPVNTKSFCRNICKDWNDPCWRWNHVQGSDWLPKSYPWHCEAYRLRWFKQRLVLISTKQKVHHKIIINCSQALTEKLAMFWLQSNSSALRLQMPSTLAKRRRTLVPGTKAWCLVMPQMKLKNVCRWP